MAPPLGALLRQAREVRELSSADAARAAGISGAYALIWLCARSAFIASISSEDPESRSDGEISRWESDGGPAA